MYRTIDARFWSDPKVRKLKPEAKLLFLYFVTNSHTHVSGIYYVPKTTVELEIGFSRKALDTLCDTLSSLELVRFDKENDIVWVVNMLHYQGRGDKNARSAAHHVVEDLHNSFLVNEFLIRYPHVYELAKTKIKIPYRYPIQPKDDDATPDQEQEQDISRPQPKQTESKFSPPSLEDVAEYCRERSNGIDPEKFISYYQSKGWLVGKTKMKDWKAAVVTWEKNESSNGKHNGQPKMARPLTREEAENWKPSS